ncbi:MAG: hypothetical protein R3C04_04130 [Hyphomonas sp.]
MSKPYEVPEGIVDLVVIGAGPVGTSLSILATQRGFSTVLVDGRDPSAIPAMDTRNFAIVRGSWRLLGATGVHPLLEGVTEPLNGLEAVDGGSHVFGAPFVLFGNEDLPEDEAGEPLGQMIPAADLQAALDRITGETEGLSWLRGARFADIDTGPACATVRLEDGTGIRAAA